MKRVFIQKPNLKSLQKDYKVVDMHFHTQYSHDGKTRISQLVKRIKELGIGVAVTDHNEIKGSILAYKQLPRQVIPAIELNCKEMKDVLVYFHNAKELLEFYTKDIKPNLKSYSGFHFTRQMLSLEKLFERLEDYQTLVCLAHPFSLHPKRSYFLLNRKKFKHLKNRFDAIEVLNASQNKKGNLASLGWALTMDKPITAGSDGHTLSWLGSAVTVSTASDTSSFLDSVMKKRNIIVGKERSVKEKIWYDLSMINSQV